MENNMAAEYNCGKNMPRFKEGKQISWRIPWI